MKGTKYMINLKNKNILFIVHNYNNFQKDIINSISEYFNHTYVLMRYKPIAEIYNYLPIKYFQSHQKKHVIQLKDKPSNVTVLPVPLYYLPTKYGYKKLGDKHFHKALMIIQKNNIRFDLIHSIFNWTAGYVGAKLKEYFKKPLIITSQENNNRFYNEYNSDNNKLYWAWENADAITRVNKHTIPLLKKYNKNVSYVSNGYDAKIFNPGKNFTKEEIRKQLNIPINGKVILNIGYLHSRKGQKYLIEAIHKLQNKLNTPIYCYIIGQGVLFNNLNKQIKKLNLDNNIKLLGLMAHDKIPQWVHASDLFVLPTLSEGNPIVMFEALGCGVPFVGTRVGGIPETVTSEDYGLLCEKEDSDDLADKIFIALNKNWDYDKIKKYWKKFSWENISKEFVELYKKFE